MSLVRPPMFSSSAPAITFVAGDERRKGPPSDLRLPPIRCPDSAGTSRHHPNEKSSGGVAAAAAEHSISFNSRRISHLSPAGSPNTGRAGHGGSARGGFAAKKSVVWLRVLRHRAKGREAVLARADVLGGVQELLRALSLQAATPGGLLDPVGVTSKSVAIAGVPDDVEPAWLCAEEVVHLVNSEAIRGGAIAAPQEEINPYLGVALKLLCQPDDDVVEVLEGDCLGILSQAAQGDDNGLAASGDALHHPTVTLSSAMGDASSNGKGKEKGTRSTPSRSSQEADYFQSFPQLRRVLCAFILNNIGVRMQAVGRPQAEILRVLLRALHRCGGVLGTGIMYNVAVTYAAMGQLDASLDAASRCADLCAVYLNVDPRRETATVLEAAELADTYTTFVVAVATHMVACQLLIAALSVHMSETSPSPSASATSAAEAAVLHCQQAVVCAKTFLPPSHPLQRRTAARLTAAEARLASVARHHHHHHHEEEGAWRDAVAVAEEAARPAPLPQLPLLSLHTDYPFSSSPMMSEAGEPDGDGASRGAAAERSGFGIAADADADSAVRRQAATATARPSFASARLSRMLLLWGNAALPRKVRGFLKRTAKYVEKGHGKGKAAATTRGTADRSSPPTRGTTAASTAADSSSYTVSAQLLRTPSAHGVLTPHPPLASPASCCGGRISAAGTTLRTADAVPAPLIVTEVSRAAFQRYRSLTRRTLRYLEGMTEDEAADTDGASAIGGSPGCDRDSAQPPHRRKASTALYYHPTPQLGAGAKDGVGASDVDAPTKEEGMAGKLVAMEPAEQMRTMDAELLLYSKLLVDVQSERRCEAACRIQRRWRCHQVILRRRRLAAEVEELRHKSECAAVVLRAYKNYTACRPAKAELRRLQVEHVRTARVVLIQQFIREKQSVEVWGRRCLAVHERLLADKTQRDIEEAYALIIQSWWRMARARTAYRRQRQAALTLSCAWRSHAARKELTRRRVLKRLAYEEFLWQHYGSIVGIQRWYRACQSRIAVRGVLEERQAAVARHLVRQEADFEERMGPWADDLAAAGDAVRRILAVLHGARARAEMRRRHFAMQCVRRILRYWVHRTRGIEVIESLREERRQTLRRQRRREEVLFATLRIQAAWRRWLRMREGEAALDAHALVHHDGGVSILESARTTGRQLQEDSDAVGELPQSRTPPLPPWHEETERELRLRGFCATKIQAMYRMYATRKAHAVYLQFMLFDRHTMARRIQRCWMRHLAHKSADQRRRILEEVARHRQREAVERVAVVRMQSVARMFLVRCRVLREVRHRTEGDGSSGRRMMGWYTPYQRFAAARCIQTAWRGCVARRYVQQVRLAAAHYAAERTATESLHAYATIIQKMVRGWLLRDRTPGLHRRTSSDTPRQAELASPHPPVPIRPATAEAGRGGGCATRHGAAIRARTWSGGGGTTTATASARTVTHAPVLQCPVSTSAPHAEDVTERQVATSPVSLTRPSTATMETQSPPVSIALPVRHIELPDDDDDDDDTSGAVAASVEEDHVRQSAAVRIQKIWRGYWTRCTSEFYFEEVEETVSESEEESEESEEEDNRAGRSAFPTMAPSSLVQSSPFAGISLASTCEGEEDTLSPYGSAPQVAQAVDQQQRREVVTQSTADGGRTATTTTTTWTTTTTTTTTTTARKVSASPRGAAAPLVSRQSPLLESYTPEQHAAATLIQKMWRGYMVRCTYEFYYEEYEEEVTVSDEDEDDNE